MGDGLKLSKDKRHRSSSSVAAVPLECARSERKLDIRASIPEMDDQFATAESRCNHLQQKIDLFKNVKKKKKTKRRSMRIAETLDAAENIPVISVQTKPKKKMRLAGEQSAAGRGGARSPYAPVYDELEDEHYGAPCTMQRVEARRGRADGDATMTGSRSELTEAACGDDEPRSLRRTSADEHIGRIHSKAALETEKQAKTQRPSDWRATPPQRQVSDEYKAPGFGKKSEERRQEPGLKTRSRQRGSHNNAGTSNGQAEERPLVQLFSNRTLSPRMAAVKTRATPPVVDEVSSGPTEDDATQPQPQAKAKACGRRRHYESPTVASRMKRVQGRTASERTFIPFVVSASTAPSHNLGVNLQQILNSLKTQQPPRGIPLTLAYHLGLGYVPGYASKSALSERGEVNAIVAGGRVLRLASHRRPSYGRALALLRAGDGLLPRYLRAVVRPRSMFDLSTRKDFLNTTGSGREQTEEVKRRLAEYAHLYRELERTDEQIHQRRNKRRDPALELRRQQLAEELRAREGFISEIVEEYGVGGDAPSPNLRATVSHTEDAYRQSNYKLNVN